MKKILFCLFSAGVILLSSCSNILEKNVTEVNVPSEKAVFSFGVKLPARNLIANATVFDKSEISSIELKIEEVLENEEIKNLDLNELGLTSRWTSLDDFLAEEFELYPGVYNFYLTLNGKSVNSIDGEGNANERPVQTAQIKNKELLAGEMTSLTFDAEYEGEGEFSLKLQLPADSTIEGDYATNYALMSIRKWPNGEPLYYNNQSFENLSLGFFDSEEDDVLSRFFTYTCLLPSGKYFLNIEFYEDKIENSIQGKNVLYNMDRIFTINGYNTLIWEGLNITPVIREGLETVKVNYKYQNVAGNGYEDVEVNSFEEIKKIGCSTDEFKEIINKKVNEEILPLYQAEKADALKGFKFNKIELENSTTVNVYFDRIRSNLYFYNNKDDEEPFYNVSALYGAEFDSKAMTKPQKEGYILTGWDVYCYSSEDDEESSAKKAIGTDISDSDFATYTDYPKVVFIAQWKNASAKFTIKMETIEIDNTQYELTADINEENASVVFTAPEDFESYTWYFDAKKQNNNTNKYEISTTSSILSGVYQITCIVTTNDGKSYQLEATVTITFDASSSTSGLSIEIVKEDIPQVIASGSLPEPVFDSEENRYSITVPDGVILEKTGKTPTSESYVWIVNGRTVGNQSSDGKTCLIPLQEIQIGRHSIICKVTAEFDDGTNFTCVLSTQLVREE